LKFKYSHQVVDDLIFENKEDFINKIRENYIKNVYNLAYSIVKDRWIAEDISQEVFFKCYKKIDGFRGDSSLKTWILSITINTSTDFIRKKVPLPLSISQGFMDIFNSIESAESAYFKLERNKQLLQNVILLPFKYQEAILLYYFFNIPINEMCQMLNVNKSTVKVRMKRGRDILGKLLQKQVTDLKE
jgi:RNA polymerase sigma-70 factor (ECF subfamily)